MNLELERLEAISKRVHYLESAVQSLRSMLLEQEALLSEIKDLLDALEKLDIQ
jgi:prefoldin subunit 5